MAVHYEVDGRVVVITLDRQEVANAIDRPTAAALADALAGEYRHGMATLATHEMVAGLEQYASGAWRGQPAR